jgi:peptidoglycan biosynthesis protein MviN/MurJ (putative lipid II flippase)
MRNLRTFLRQRSGPLILIGLALATSSLFKVAAFAREAFIAAKFGLSAVTDVYFALQQLPLILATFMFGAFMLAFAPAFADSRRSGSTVAWLPGLTIIGVLTGLSLTGLTLAAAPLLLQVVQTDDSASAWNTLRILSAAFAPIVCIGIWAGICTASGRNLRTMTITGLPYLVMTLWLIGLYAAGMLNNMSLPVSMTAGFGLVGLYALVRIVCLQPGSFRPAAVFSLWRIAEFRAFLRQLGASTLENSGYAANQLLVLYFLSRAGPGIISGNNCAMRIGMLGYNLLAFPLAQLVQAKLCAAKERDRPAQFQRWLGATTVLTAAFAVILFLLKIPII